MREEYWEQIPIGKENAITYSELCHKWRMSERMVRRVLQELSRNDNGDSYILIRSSHGKGFYRSNDIHDIEMYKRECKNRARNVIAPLVKINRVISCLDNVSERNLFDYADNKCWLF